VLERRVAGIVHEIVRDDVRLLEALEGCGQLRCPAISCPPNP